MTSRRIAGLGTIALLGLACGSAAPPVGARHRLLGLDDRDPVARRLAAPHRMAVVYWPAIGRCSPAELRFARALADLARRFPDMEVVTVIPDGTDGDGLSGVAFPGVVVALGPAAYGRQRALAPLPRVEVWSGAGEPLLLRSIPPLEAQAELLAEEIEWSRAFTRPLAVKPGGRAAPRPRRRPRRRSAPRRDPRASSRAGA
jgi:hypothetical protein